MVQILLMLKVLYTQGSKVAILFRGAPSISEPSLSLAIMSLAWGLSLFEMTFSLTLLE